MANWTTPSLTDLYTNFLAFLKDRDVDLAKAFDPAKITTYPTNIPTDTVRWSSASSRWELYNGATWVELLPLATGKYSINVDRLDGLDANNAAGNIPVSNGTVNADLNADMLDGYHAGNAANQVLVLDAGAFVPVANLATSGITAGTYRSITVDAKGRATGATNPTTIAGYELTDAAPINSPTFTGTPLSTTPTAGDNTTKIATTAYAQTELALKANVDNPIFTGTIFVNNANVSLGRLAADSLQLESAQNSIITGKSAFYAVANAYWDGANWHSRNTLAPSTAIEIDAAGNAVKVLTSAATTGIITWATNTLWHSGNDGAGSGLDADLFGGQNSSVFALLASPAFTGAPSAPTAAAGTNTAQLASTAFVSTASQLQSVTAFTTAGTATAFTLTPTPPLAALTTNHRFNVTFDKTAGVNPTMAVSGLAPKLLKVYDSAGVKQPASTIVANFNSDIIYDGAHYVVVTPIIPPPAAGANIASAATINLTLATGNIVTITGTATISALTMNAGQQMMLVAADALPLIFNATTMNIEGGVSFTCAAGDRLYVFKGLDGVIRVNVVRQNGTAVVSAASITRGQASALSVNLIL